MRDIIYEIQYRSLTELREEYLLSNILYLPLHCEGAAADTLIV